MVVPRVFDFTAIITKSDDRGSGAFVSFPFDLESTFGTRGQVKVQVEFDGIPYRGSIVNMGAGPCIGILKSIREQLGKQPGDTVHVRLWKDEEPRVIETPVDLAEAMSAAPAAKEMFESLSYTHKREYVQWIASAKKAETRAARVAKTVAPCSRARKHRSNG